MRQSLAKLIELMPPPEAPNHREVDWPLLEEHVGLEYPRGFKEFVKVYGSCHWFDKLIPFYACPRTAAEARRFVSRVCKNLKFLEGNMYDEEYRRIDLPLYPRPGGLFPFMADIDGPLYCWLTEDEEPDRWPVYCWMTGAVVVLPSMAVSDMLLGFLKRSPPMVTLWGDVRKFPPERIRIDNRS